MNGYKKVIVLVISTLLKFYEMVSSLFWVIFLFPIYYFTLKIKGYESVRFFNFLSWHLSCRYLTANKSGKKFFIKCGRLFLIHNEYNASLKFSQIDEGMIPIIRDHVFLKFSPVNFVVIEFLEEYQPLSDFLMITKNECEVLKQALCEILEGLNRVSIKHRDITPSNIFVKRDDFSDIKLIDFAMSEGEGMLPLNFLFLNYIVNRSLGGKYRASKSEWDDMVSVEKILAEYFVNSQSSLISGVNDG